MAIPDTILSKPGPLDDDEWAFMHRHTLIGEAILSASPALVPVARIVRSSHERFDGGGYPDALVGTAIPIAARVVAVCDAYDAMTSDRSYRRGMSRRGRARGAAAQRRHAVRPAGRRRVLRRARGAGHRRAPGRRGYAERLSRARRRESFQRTSSSPQSAIPATRCPTGPV